MAAKTSGSWTQTAGTLRFPVTERGTDGGEADEERGSLVHVTPCVSETRAYPVKPNGTDTGSLGHTH